MRRFSGDSGGAVSLERFQEKGLPFHLEGFKQDHRLAARQNFEDQQPLVRRKCLPALGEVQRVDKVQHLPQFLEGVAAQELFQFRDKEGDGAWLLQGHERGRTVISSCATAAGYPLRQQRVARLPQGSRPVKRHLRSEISTLRFLLQVVSSDPITAGRARPYDVGYMRLSSTPNRFK